MLSIIIWQFSFVDFPLVQRLKVSSYAGFLKWVPPNHPMFRKKCLINQNIWGYPHFRKPPYQTMMLVMASHDERFILYSHRQPRSTVLRAAEFSDWWISQWAEKHGMNGSIISEFHHAPGDHLNMYMVQYSTRQNI